MCVCVCVCVCLCVCEYLKDRISKIEIVRIVVITF